MARHCDIPSGSPLPWALEDRVVELLRCPAGDLPAPELPSALHLAAQNGHRDVVQVGAIWLSHGFPMAFLMSSGPKHVGFQAFLFCFGEVYFKRSSQGH